MDVFEAIKIFSLGYYISTEAQDWLIILYKNFKIFKRYQSYIYNYFDDSIVKIGKSWYFQEMALQKELHVIVIKLCELLKLLFLSVQYQFQYVCHVQSLGKPKEKETIS